MPSSHALRRSLRRVSVIAALAVAAVVALRGADDAFRTEATPRDTTDVAVAPLRVDPPTTRTAASPSAPPALPDVPPPPRDASPAAAALIADAAAARQQGDLRTTVELLRAAVEASPSVETHAALGGLYLELGAARAAEPHLRAAAEGDPMNADRWIALANALALKPDPMAAAGALEQARAVEPALDVTRDAIGLVVRVQPH
jgi:tetratricopeptide (TPR) repeat protein